MIKNLLIALCVMCLLGGCYGSPDETAIKKWVQEKVSVCGGVVNEFTLIREGLLSNKFVGFVEVTLGNRKYYPDIVVYSDNKNTFYQLQSNPCSLPALR